MAPVACTGCLQMIENPGEIMRRRITGLHCTAGEPASRRAALTRIELLVVITMLAIAIALALPALQSTRETARRNQCLSHMKQIGTAARNYLSSHKSFPSGWICDSDISGAACTVTAPVAGPLYADFAQAQTVRLPTKASRPFDINPMLRRWSISSNWGWQALLLPQMDASAVGVDFRQSKDAAANRAAATRVISSYVCPSAALAARRPSQYAYSTYRGCMGSTPTNGTMYMNSHVSDRTVKDGTTTTILFGETQYGFWADGLSCCGRVPNPDPKSESFDPKYNSNDVGPPPRDLFDFVSDPPSVDGKSNIFREFGFGSWHDDVAMFGMVDGSARQISKSISPTVMEALATRDSRFIGSDDF